MRYHSGSTAWRLLVAVREMDWMMHCTSNTLDIHRTDPRSRHICELRDSDSNIPAGSPKLHQVKARLRGKYTTYNIQRLKNAPNLVLNHGFSKAASVQAEGVKNESVVLSVLTSLTYIELGGVEFGVERYMSICRRESIVMEAEKNTRTVCCNKFNVGDVQAQPPTECSPNVTTANSFTHKDTFIAEVLEICGKRITFALHLVIAQVTGLMLFSRVIFLQQAWDLGLSSQSNILTRLLP
ncbi:hypothetical protein P167DRAFT_545816 [Morchella conica CCBAS932]|uniref:Uncharacterized protein n=1 Tax=Morchella conica CCBAS932 TaxID=1392247 RepID=A0A3N4KN46_9PEZI|nr:hypothetical protein P167DRAFT_545816 [Morchella conica CCBAS932]